MGFCPEPTCWPPEEWQEEYCEWMTWQQQLQRDYTNETGYELGALISFMGWAEMRECNEPYWWKPDWIDIPIVLSAKATRTSS